MDYTVTRRDDAPDVQCLDMWQITDGWYYTVITFDGPCIVNVGYSHRFGGGEPSRASIMFWYEGADGEENYMEVGFAGSWTFTGEMEKGRTYTVLMESGEGGTRLDETNHIETRRLVALDAVTAMESDA